MNKLLYSVRMGFFTESFSFEATIGNDEDLKQVMAKVARIGNAMGWNMDEEDFCPDLVKIAKGWEYEDESVSLIIESGLDLSHLS